MKPTIHHTPGRIRLRHNRFRTNAARFRAFCRETRAIEGIFKCNHNPYAGSVTIVYDDRRLSGDELLERLCQRIRISMATASVYTRIKAKSSDPMKAVAKAGGVFGQALFAAFAKQTVERSVFTMVTTVLK